MADAQYYLTEQDKADLTELLRAYRSGALGTPQRIDSRRALGIIEEIAIGKTDDAVSPDGSGDVTRWTVTSDAFAATSPVQTLTVYDWVGAGIADDTKVLLARVQHKEGTRWVHVAGGQDIFVAIESGNTTGYLKDQFQDFNASAQYEVNKDPLIEVENIGTAPNKNLQLFIDANSWPGYSAGGTVQSFGKVTADAITWFGYAATSPWLTVAFTSGNVAYSHAGPNSGETTTTIGAAAMGAGTPDATSFNFTSSPNAGEFWFVSRLYNSTTVSPITVFLRKATQDSLGHMNLIGGESSYDLGFVDKLVSVDADQTPQVLFTNMTDTNAVAQYVSGKDLLIEFERDGTTPNKTMRGFVDANSYPGFSAGVLQFLGKDTSDDIRWGVPTDTDTDIFVSVESGNTAGYLFDQWEEVNTSAQYEVGKDPVVEIERVGSAPNKNLRGFVDANSYPGYSAGTAQFLGKDTSDLLLWSVPIDTDKFVAIDSANTPNYLAALLNNYSAPAYDAADDYIIKYESVGTAPNQSIRGYIDVSSIASYTAAVFQIHGKDASNDVRMFDPVGDSWISITVAATNDATWSHIGPVNSASGGGITEVILGSTGTYAADTNTFTGTGSNFLRLRVMTRTEWDNTNPAAPKWYEYTREIKWDTKGHEYSCSAETRREVVTPTDCTSV